jgi:hypothetical protein
VFRRGAFDVRVFCVGLRDGSNSLKLALQRLGYGPVYSMGNTAQYYSHLRAWYLHGTGRRKLDLKRFLARYDATKAHPAMLFPEDLLAAFPDVKVIILQRDAESWFRSYSRMYHKICAVTSRLRFLPRFRLMRKFFFGTTFDLLGPGDEEHKDRVIAARQRLFERVEAVTPPAQLLRFDVRDDWEPLCKFLDQPVPEEPFPWSNRDDSAIHRTLRNALLRDAAWVGAAVAILGTLGLSPLGLGLLGGEAALFSLLYYLHRV